MLPAVPSLRGHCAGFASRMVAFILDVVVFSLTLSAAIWAVSQIGLLLQFLIFFDPIEHIIAIINQYVHLEQVSDTGIAGIFSLIGPGLLYIIYYVVFWSTAERTPGKAFMGLRVVTTEGKRLPVWRSFVRCIGYFLSGIPFLIGFLRVLWDDQRQGLHDKLARTYVIYDWDARPDERFLTESIHNLRVKHLRREGK